MSGKLHVGNLPSSATEEDLFAVHRLQCWLGFHDFQLTWRSFGFRNVGVEIPGRRAQRYAIVPNEQIDSGNSERPS